MSKKFIAKKKDINNVGVGKCLADILTQIIQIKEMMVTKISRIIANTIEYSIPAVIFIGIFSKTMHECENAQIKHYVKFNKK